MPRKPAARILPSGLREDSPEADAAERAESEAFDRAHGLTPRTPAERAALVREGERRSRALHRSLRGQGIDLRA